MKRKRQPQTCGTPSTKRKIALAQRRALKQHNCISYLHVDFHLLHAIVLDATNKIQGGVIVNSVNVPGADENTITFAHAADTIGDFVELNCDGTNWYVFGLGTTAGAITLTAV